MYCMSHNTDCTIVKAGLEIVFPPHNKLVDNFKKNSHAAWDKSKTFQIIVVGRRTAVKKTHSRITNI